MTVVADPAAAAVPNPTDGVANAGTVWSPVLVPDVLLSLVLSVPLRRPDAPPATAFATTSDPPVTWLAACAVGVLASVRRLSADDTMPPCAVVVRAACVASALVLFVTSVARLLVRVVSAFVRLVASVAIAVVFVPTFVVSVVSSFVLFVTSEAKLVVSVVSAEALVVASEVMFVCSVVSAVPLVLASEVSAVVVANPEMSVCMMSGIFSPCSFLYGLCYDLTLFRHPHGTCVGYGVEVGYCVLVG